MIIFHRTIIYIGTLVILISAIYAFKLRRKKELPVYFKFFYCIPFAALLLSINGIVGVFFNKYTAPLYNILQHLFFLLEFSFICFVFYVVFDRKTKFPLIVFSIAIIFFGILLLISGIYKVSFQLYAAPDLAIFILCMYYYYRLFDHDEKPIQNLFTTPTFWIVTGLFFFSAITLPLFAIQEYFTYKFGYKISGYIIAFANIFIIVKHLFFIKAYRLAAKMESEETKIIIEDVEL